VYEKYMGLQLGCRFLFAVPRRPGPQSVARPEGTRRPTRPKPVGIAGSPPSSFNVTNRAKRQAAEVVSALWRVKKGALPGASTPMCGS